jgi:superfamily I DNA and RNA helicase
VIPLLGGPRMLMTRNLLYTAVTRARKCVTIVGSDVTFQAMIGNHIEAVYNARQKNPGNAGRKRINTFFRGMDAAASGRVDKGKRRLHERKK